MSFSTSSSPCSCGESTAFRELASGCRVRVKHCKDALSTNGLCPSAELGIVRGLQVSTALPGTLGSLGITLTLVVTTPCVSVLEQPLKHTGKLCFWISKPKRERQGPGKRLHPPDDSPRLRVCLQQHLPSAHAAQDWQLFVTDVTSLTPPGDTTRLRRSMGSGSAPTALLHTSKGQVGLSPARDTDLHGG